MKTKRFMALTKVSRSAVCIMWYRNGIKWQKHSAFFEGYATAQDVSCHCLVAVNGD
jgi:N-acetyl-anhydromuramyl-L-alanine amidase AmpD